MVGQEGWLIDAFITWLRDLSPHAALLAVLLSLGACGLGLPVPEDIILITTGFLAAMGKYPVWLGIMLGMVGVLCGDSLMFFVGRRYGEGVFELPLVQRLVHADQIEAARTRVRSHARFICFIARFLPGLRAPLYLTAGAMGVRPRTFMVQDGLAASVSVPLWVALGWTFGDHIERALMAARQIQGWVLGATVLSVVAYFVWRRWRAHAARPEA